MTRPANDQAPPQNIEAEESLLGAMLVAEQALPQVIDEVKLNAADFYLDRHRSIFEAIHDLYAASKPVDELTVTAALTKSQRAPFVDAAIEPRHYVSELAAKVPVAGNAWHYAEIVQQDSLLRRLLKHGQETVKLVTTRNCDSPDVLLDRVQASLDSARPAVDQARLRVETLGQLFESSPETVEGIWGRWLVAGEIASIAARGGIGKTTFTRSLIGHAARGSNFLGVSFSHPLRILYLTREGSGPFWVAKMRRTAVALGLDAEALGRVHVVQGGGDCGLRLSRPEDVNKVRRIAESVAPDVIAFDPFRGFMEGNENDGADQAAALDGAAELAREFNAAIWLPHHASQTGKGIDAFRGHTTFEGAIATGFVLEGAAGNRRLNPVKTRYSMEPDDERLRFLGFDMETEVYSEDEREEVLPTKERLRHILADKDWHKVTGITVNLGITRQALKVHLDVMHKAGEIDREKREHGADFVRFRGAETEIGEGSI